MITFSLVSYKRENSKSCTYDALVLLLVVTCKEGCKSLSFTDIGCRKLLILIVCGHSNLLASITYDSCFSDVDAFNWWCIGPFLYTGGIPLMPSLI